MICATKHKSFQAFENSGELLNRPILSLEVCSDTLVIKFNNPTGSVGQFVCSFKNTPLGTRIQHIPAASFRNSFRRRVRGTNKHDYRHFKWTCSKRIRLLPRVDRLIRHCASAVGWHHSAERLVPLCVAGTHQRWYLIHSALPWKPIDDPAWFRDGLLSHFLQEIKKNY